MIPVLLGSTALIGYALFGQRSTPEQFGVAQWGPPRPINVGPGLLAAVKDLGNTAARFDRLQQRLGPIFSQVELHHNENNEPGYLRGFAITIGPYPPGATPPEAHQDLKLLEAIAVLVGIRHGLQPSLGVVKLPDGFQTMIVGFSTTPDRFWSGEMAMLPSPQEARQIAQDIGGHRPGFDPGYIAKQTMAKAQRVSMATSGGGRRFRFPAMNRRG